MVSMHEHYRVHGNMDEYVKVMDELGIEKAIFLPTGHSPNNARYREYSQELAKVAKQYPGKIYWFATTWSKDPEAVNVLDDQIRQGARGIKLLDWLKGFEGAELDGPQMYAIYALAKKHQLPMLLHVDLQKHPEWIPKLEKAVSEFPTVTFVLAHYCRAASEPVPDLAICGRILEKHPNVHADISMGGGVKRYMRYFDHDPETFREFILTHQDKLMWGTDMILDGQEEKTATWMKRRIMQDITMMATPIYLSPFYKTDTAVHQGLALPREVLEKLFYKNAVRVLAVVFSSEKVSVLPKPRQGSPDRFLERRLRHPEFAVRGGAIEPLGQSRLVNDAPRQERFGAGERGRELGRRRCRHRQRIRDFPSRWGDARLPSHPPRQVTESQILARQQISSTLHASLSRQHMA